MKAKTMISGDSRYTPRMVLNVLSLAKSRGFLGFVKGFDPCYSEVVNRANAILSALTNCPVSSFHLAQLLRVSEFEVAIYLNCLLALNLISSNKRTATFARKSV